MDFTATYGQLGIIKMYPTISKIECDYGFHSTPHLKAIVDAFGKWTKKYLDMGWDGYLFQVMFHDLAGSRETKIIQMKQEVERVYNRLATRMVRKPNSLRWAGYLPIGLFVPELQVPKKRKSKKSTIADISINDGLHMSGIILGNRWGRVRTSLVDHFAKFNDHYVTGKVRDIYVDRIIHDPEYTVDYALKSLPRRDSSPDDLLVLNWGGSARRPSIFKEMIRKALGRDRTIWMSSDNGCIPALPHV
jgi:hypothetical protein